MRIGQALGLRHSDFVSRKREVHVVPRTDNANRARAKLRSPAVLPVSFPLVRLCRAPRTDRFFVSATGRALRREEADRVFRVITGLIGLRTGTVRPRIHDMRHSFAVRTLIDGHRDGRDVSALLPVLSTYLGHVEPANTYWYLSAVPELMQMAAARLEQHSAGRS